MNGLLWKTSYHVTCLFCSLPISIISNFLLALAHLTLLPWDDG